MAESVIFICLFLNFICDQLHGLGGDVDVFFLILFNKDKEEKNTNIMRTTLQSLTQMIRQMIMHLLRRVRKMLTQIM